MVWLLALIVSLAPAWAAPPPGVDLNTPKAKWIENLKMPKGGSCCSVSDCRPIPGAAFHDGRWWAGIGDPVPEEVILRNEESYDGQAWGCRSSTGSWYCFVPPGSAG